MRAFVRMLWRFVWIPVGEEEPVESGSRLVRAGSTDGIGGRHWLGHLLLSHGLVWAGILGGLQADSTVDRVVLPLVAVAGVVLSALWWRSWLRTWRRV
jgi:hypothetical protein